MAKIYLKFNAAVIKEIELEKNETTFGRKPGNDILIENPAVSGFHGKIMKDGDHYIVVDLNSTNGLFINGQRTQKAILKNKDNIGVAKHILQFISDPASAPTETAAPPTRPATSETTPVAPLAPAPVEIKETPKPISEPPPPPKRQFETPAPSASLEPLPIQEPIKEMGSGKAPGVIKILAGGVNNQTEVKLKDLVTYIGASDQAAIKIKGFMAPSLAAAISKRPEGYFLKAVKAGYPKVNGQPVSEQIFLENGSQIEAGGTNMVFYSGDAKKQGENSPENT